MITPQTAWRDSGDTTAEAFAAELSRLNSPMQAEAAAIYEAARPFSLLVLAHSFAENKHDTVGRLITPDMKNFMALRPRRYPEEAGERNGFATFASYAVCVRAWRRRLTDASIDSIRTPKNYAAATSLLEYCTVYNPPGDVHPITGLENAPARYCNELLETINRLPAAAGPAPEGPVSETQLNLSKGLIPMPAFEDWLANEKVEGVGMNRLGPRTLRGIVFHRAQSDGQVFREAVGWLRRPDVQGLTDFYVDNNSAKLYRINAITGTASDMAGWANGPYNAGAASADAQAFVAKYGPGFASRSGVGAASVINNDLESCEVAGNYGDPVSEATKGVLVQWAASRAQDLGVRWDKFPISPDGVTVIFGHREFCGVAFKPCPGEVVWAFVNGELIDRVKELMRRYQTGEITGAPSGERPAPPATVYAKADVPPILKKAPYPSFGTIGEATATLVNDQYRALSETPVLQYADRASKPVRAALAQGEDVAILYVFEANGERWGLSRWGSRVPLKDMERISDTAQA